MAEENILKNLAKLTTRQREVLSMFCQGKSYEEIAKQLFISNGAVRSHLANIYESLGMDLLSVYERRKVIFQQYCPALQEFDFEKRKNEPKEPVPSPSYVLDLVDEDEKALIVIDQGFNGKKEEPIPPDTPPRPPRPPIGRILRWIILVIFIGFLIIGGVRVYIWLSELLSEQQHALDNNVQSDQMKPKDFVEETPIISEPDSFTNTPDFIQPPVLPQPEILFIDNFDAGLSSGWQVAYGNPLMVNGLLTTDEDTMMIIGNSEWTDYAVEFDADAGYCWLSRAENWISVRATNTDNNYAYKWGDCESYWFIVKGGSWKEVTTSEFSPGYDTLRFRIQVEDGNIAVYVGGLLMSSFHDNSFSQGKVILRISENTTVDNFKISKIE